MTINDYQAAAHETAIYPALHISEASDPSGTPAPYLYPAIGLVGEAGELANKIKKVFRDEAGVLDADGKHAIAMELGDVLWYVSELAGSLGYSLNEIAELNVAKLRARAVEKTLQGEGDAR